MPETNLKNVRKTQMGANKPYYAKVTAETDTALPTYGTPSAFSEFIKVTENLQKAETQFYSDDAMSENVSEFKYCELTYDNKGLSDSVIGDIYGVNVDSSTGEVTYGGDDTPPYIGFGFYRSLMDNGVKYYEGIFYPKVKASLVGAAYETRGENVNLSGDSTSMIAYQCKDTKKTWKITDMFATAAEAENWIKKKFGAME